MRCPSGSEFASRRLIRASQGTRRASMSGVFSFGTFHWTSKEKSLAQQGRKTRINSRTLINKKATAQYKHKSPVRQHKKMPKANY